MAKKAIVPDFAKRLVMRPTIESEWEDGSAVLLKPKFMSGPLAWWLQPHLKNPHLRITLDELGSFVWRRCNGQTNVEQIAQELKAQFGEQFEYPMERVWLFLKQLHAQGVIEFLERM
jgi:hypothetical protein